MPQTLIKLRPPRTDHGRRDDRFAQLSYRESTPFFNSPSAVLCHRVRSLYRLTFKNGEPWFIVDYWCENNARPKAWQVDDALVFDPGDRLLCKRCEARAVAAGEKTASELAGRHVCIGICVPVNVCQQHGNA